MSALRGTPQLRARLKALRLTFKPLGKGWAEDTRDAAIRFVPYRTGRLRGSIRVRNVTQRHATVVAHYSAFFVDKGTKPHTIVPKKAKTLRFENGRKTVFSRRAVQRGYRARPFRARAAEEGLKRNPLAVAVVRQWNEARG